MTNIAAALNYTAPASMMQMVAKVSQMISRGMERRRAARAMHMIDARTLKDIGIDRSEIMSVVYSEGQGRRQTYISN